MVIGGHKVLIGTEIAFSNIEGEVGKITDYVARSLGTQRLYVEDIRKQD
jgi:hypothetical protein